MATANRIKPIGVLNPNKAERKFDLELYPPAPDLAFFIEYYWVVKWDLRGQEPYLQENLPHPSVHLVIEPDRARVYGIISGKFSYLLQGQEQAFGIKFRPGAFYPFVKMPIAKLINNSKTLKDIFGPDGGQLETAIRATPAVPGRIAIAENFLRQRLPEQDENVSWINQVIEQIIHDRSIIKVDDLIQRFGFSKRSLQRIFSQYVGASPKWVIMRYRLLEAAEYLAVSQVDDWSEVALELGYFDQAHFIKDFKTIVGCTPAEYVKSIEPGSK